MTDRICITQPVFVSSPLNCEPSLVASTTNPIRFSIPVNELGIKTRNVLNIDKKITNRSLLQSTYVKTNAPLASQTGSNLSENGIKTYRKRPGENFQNTASGKIFVQSSFPQPANCQIVCKTDKTDVLNQDRNICHFSQISSGESNKDHEFLEKSGNLSVLGERSLLPKQSKHDIPSKQNPGLMSIGNSTPHPSLHHSRRKQERPLKSVRFADKENTDPEEADKTIYHDNVSGLNSDVVKTQYNRNVTMNQKFLPKDILLRPNRPVSFMPSTGCGTKTEESGNKNLSEKITPSVLHPVGSNAKKLGGAVSPLHPQMVSCMHSAGRPSLQSPKQKYSDPLPKYSYTGPLPYRRMGTATRSNPVSLKKCRIIFPAQVKTACNLSTKANSANVNTATPHLLTVPVACTYKSVGGKGSTNPLTVLKPLDQSVQPLGNLPKFQSRTSPPVETCQSGNLSKSLILLVSDPTNNPSAPSQKESETVNKSKASVQETCSQQAASGKRGTNKIQETQLILTKISQLLIGIDKTLASGFECPGLEPSLPIWKLELEQCILSVEKIKCALLVYQNKIK